MHSTSFPVAGVRLGLTAALLGTTALVAAPAMAQSGSAGQGLGEIVVNWQFSAPSRL